MKDANNPTRAVRPTITITISGPQGSGKTTIAMAICELFKESDIRVGLVNEDAPDGDAIEKLYMLAVSRACPAVEIRTVQTLSYSNEAKTAVLNRPLRATGSSRSSGCLASSYLGSTTVAATRSTSMRSTVSRGCCAVGSKKSTTAASSKTHRPGLRPVVTKRKTFHRVVSEGTSWVLSFRGPWSKTWREYDPASGNTTTLGHGRVQQ